MKRKRQNSLIFWLFLAPVLFTFVMVIVIPFFLGIFYSFTNWSATSRAGEVIRFIGFANFTRSLGDPGFLYSFLITAIYTVLNMAVVNAAALALALLVTSRLRFRNVYRVGFFLPNLIGGLILGYIWQFIFNNALPYIGQVFPGLAHLADPGNLVLGKVPTAVLALITAGTWKDAGYIMMIYVAAIESIPQELNEAARIDGATGSQRFMKITVPMVAQAFTITLFLTLINSFKQFDVNVSLTAGGPSAMFMGKPIFGTQLLALNIYRTAFVGNDMAAGQARAVLFFIVLVVISTLQVNANKKKEVEM
jgi:raffinose/stachyose/melibiose transport system permease protein